MIVLLFLVFIFICICLVIPFRKKRWLSIAFWGVGFLMILLAGFREIGWDNDSLTYSIMYNDLFSGYNFTTEPSFVFISYFVNLFFGNVRFLFFIYAILGVYLKLFALKRITELWILALLIYFSKFFVLLDMTQIRAGISCAFFLLAIPPLAERKWVQFCFFAVSAVLFHYSALLIFPLCLLQNNSLSKKTRLLLFMLIPLGYIMYYLKLDFISLALYIPLPAIQAKMQGYIVMEKIGLFKSINPLSPTFLVRSLIFGILLWKYPILEKNNNYVSILLKIESVSLFSFLALSRMGILSQRINEFYSIVEIITFTFLYYCFKPKILSKVILVFISLFYMYFFLIFPDGKG